MEKGTWLQMSILDDGWLTFVAAGKILDKVHSNLPPAILPKKGNNFMGDKIKVVKNMSILVPHRFFLNVEVIVLFSAP